MNKLNKKGFTLIELLAVIVILAVIMVIAVPQILDVINSSKKSAWESNVKLIQESIELNITIGSTGSTNFSMSELGCNEVTNTDITDKISQIADINDTTVSCKIVDSTYQLTLTPTSGGQFSGQETATITYDGNTFTNDLN